MTWHEYSTSNSFITQFCINHYTVHNNIDPITSNSVVHLHRLGCDSFAQIDQETCSSAFYCRLSVSMTVLLVIKANWGKFIKAIARVTDMCEKLLIIGSCSINQAWTCDADSCWWHSEAPVRCFKQLVKAYLVLHCYGSRHEKNLGIKFCAFLPSSSSILVMSETFIRFNHIFLKLHKCS